MHLAVTLALAALLLAACGDDDDTAPLGSGDPATVEADVAALDGIRYRLLEFRRLDLGEAPDSEFYDGDPPGRGEGVFAAFVMACNVGSELATTASDVALDAGGDRIEPLDSGAENPFAYTGDANLAPGQCAPLDGSVAEPVSGLAVAFALPLDAADDPLFLELGSGSERVRLEVER